MTSQESSSSINGPGWYLISSSFGGSFIDVIQNYATKLYPKAQYSIYDTAFSVPEGWTDNDGNATFNNKDWKTTSNINNPNVMMASSLGYWIKILSYNPHIVSNQSQLLVGCLSTYIAISTDGKGWQNLKATGGTSIGPQPSEVSDNKVPYFSSFLFQGKSSNSGINNVFISTIKNKVSNTNDNYINEIYRLNDDNTVSTNPINKITSAFVYNIDNITTSDNYYWLASGYNNRYTKTTPNPFYNTYNDSNKPSGYKVEFYDWSKNNTSSYPLWATSDINNTFTRYLLGQNGSINNDYYINDGSSSPKKWYPTNVNSQLITSKSSSGNSFYLLGGNGYYFCPKIDNNNNMTLQAKNVSSSLYYTNTSIFNNNISSIQSQSTSQANTTWTSGFPYTAGPNSYQVYPKTNSVSFPGFTSTHNIIEGVIGTTKTIMAIQRTININNIYNDIEVDENGNIDFKNVNIHDIDASCTLCYIELDDLETPGAWKTLNSSVSISQSLLKSTFSISYIQKLYYIKELQLWFMSCLDKDKNCILLKSTNPTADNFDSWTPAYDTTSQISLFPIKSTTSNNSNKQQYYQVNNIIQNNDINKNCFILSINGNELALNSSKEVGTYYADLDNNNNFSNITESIPTIARNNTFNSIIKRNIEDIVYEIKNNESSTIIPNFIQQGFGINILAVAGGGISGTNGSINSDTNNATRSIINYSSSGAGGAAASFTYGNNNNLTVKIDDAHNIVLDFGIDGTITLNSGGTGKSYSEDNVNYIATGGTYTKNLRDGVSEDHIQNDILNNGFKDGLNGSKQKSIVYNDNTQAAANDAFKYSPDGGDGGIVTTDLAGNNNYGIGGSGT